MQRPNSAFQKSRARLLTPSCPHCDSDDIVFDSKEGQKVCNDCGTILEMSVINEGTEYRTFTESDKPTGDPTRVAAGPLGTNIAKAATDDGGLAYSLTRRMQQSGMDSDARFTEAFKKIKSQCEQLNLHNDVRDLACELYRLYASDKERVPDLLGMSAACVFESCKQQDNERSLKEIDKAASGQASIRKRISKQHRALVRKLQERMQERAREEGLDLNDVKNYHSLLMHQGADTDRAANHPSSMIPRFGSDIGLSPRGIQIGKKVSKLIKPDDLDSNMEHQPWHGKQPLTLCAVTLYITVHLGGRALQPGLQPPTLQDLSSICSVAQSTIEQTYAQLYPHLRSLVPPDMRPPMKEADWQKFPKPTETAK